MADELSSGWAAAHRQTPGTGPEGDGRAAAVAAAAAAEAAASAAAARASAAIAEATRAAEAAARAAEEAAGVLAERPAESTGDDGWTSSPVGPVRGSTAVEPPQRQPGTDAAVGSTGPMHEVPPTAPARPGPDEWRAGEGTSTAPEVTGPWDARPLDALDGVFGETADALGVVPLPLAGSSPGLDPAGPDPLGGSLDAGPDRPAGRDQGPVHRPDRNGHSHVGAPQDQRAPGRPGPVDGSRSPRPGPPPRGAGTPDTNGHVPGPRGGAPSGLNGHRPHPGPGHDRRVEPAMSGRPAERPAPPRDADPVTQEMSRVDPRPTRPEELPARPARAGEPTDRPSSADAPPWVPARSPRPPALPVLPRHRASEPVGEATESMATVPPEADDPAVVTAVILPAPARPAHRPQALPPEPGRQVRTVPAPGPHDLRVPVPAGAPAAPGRAGGPIRPPVAFRPGAPAAGPNPDETTIRPLAPVPGVTIAPPVPEGPDRPADAAAVVAVDDPQPVAVVDDVLGGDSDAADAADAEVAVPAARRGHRGSAAGGRRRSLRGVLAVAVAVVLLGLAGLVTTLESEPEPDAVAAAPATATRSAPTAAAPATKAQVEAPLRAAVDPKSRPAAAYLAALRAAKVPTSRTGLPETEAAAVICQQLANGTTLATMTRALPSVLTTVTSAQAPVVVEAAQEHYC